MKTPALNPISVILFALAAISLSAVAQSELVRIDDIFPEEIEVAGFELSQEQEVEIDAVGAHIRDRHNQISTAWILNADTREIVWELTDANSRWKSRRLREYHDQVKLDAGRYEVYYSNFPPYYYDDGWSFSRFFFKDEDDKVYEEAFDEFQIVVRGSGKQLSEDDIKDRQKDLRDKAILSLSGERDERYEKQGFKLKKEMDVVVYCLGEMMDDGAYDYGWIIDTDTRERVWRMRYRRTDDAGGAEKNRVYRETVTLDAGNYAAFYVTDDSHSPRQWNATPPYDPGFWGMTIFASNESERNNVSLFDYEDIPPKNIIVDFAEMRDDDFQTTGFTLKKDTKVRIYALGEGTRGQMYDYGWLVNANTRERIWEMEYYVTEHAGGAQKNRVFDEVIELPKGNYIASYVTDDSHSFRRWNDSPPFDPERWGLTIMGADDNFNSRDVTEYSEEDDESVLVSIKRVRDGESERATFKIDDDTDVRVYAIGEGDGGQMYDYAWIEDRNTGRVVWEMSYRRTDHAGGARKNRMFDDLVRLRKGEYIAYYETDDSHSFSDWNASPPRDPDHWGVTIYSVEE